MSTAPASICFVLYALLSLMTEPASMFLVESLSSLSRSRSAVQQESLSFPLPPTAFHAAASAPLRGNKIASKKDNSDDNDDESVGEMNESLGLTPSRKSPSTEDDEEQILGYAIDSFLRGDYDRQFAEDAPAPHPGLNPGAVIDSVLRSLRKLDDPEPLHGAAVLQRFCVPLSRGERWGDSSRTGRDPWKEIMRGALTPSMLARRIRASEFSGLLDWKHMDVTEGAYGLERDLVGVPSIAFVNAALYFGEGIEPLLIQFTLRRLGGVWLIDTARRSQEELFVENG